MSFISIYFGFSKWNEQHVDVILERIIGWCKLICQKVNTVWTQRLIIDGNFQLFGLEKYQTKFTNQFFFKTYWKLQNTFFTGAMLLGVVDCSTFVSLDAITCDTIAAIRISNVGNSIFFEL